MGHVEWLAAPEREGRGIGTDGLDAAAEYVAAAFKAIGLKPGGDNGTYFQSFVSEEVADRRSGQPAQRDRRPAGQRSPNWAGQSALLTAHYDHLGLGWPDVHAGDEGKLHPGADDNASGVAVMLELAQALAAAGAAAAHAGVRRVHRRGGGAAGLAALRRRTRPFPLEKVDRRRSTSTPSAACATRRSR